MTHPAKPDHNGPNKELFQDFVEENGIIITDELPPMDEEPEEVILYDEEDK